MVAILAQEPHRQVRWVRFAKMPSTFHARSSDSHFKQPVNEGAKAPPPLFSQGAGSAGHFHPLDPRGGMLPHEREGSGAPKGAGNIDTPCGARPVRWAFTSRRSTAAFFLRPRDRLL